MQLILDVFRSGMDTSDYMVQAVAAASSWTCTCTATNPLWVVKIRMQTQHALGVVRYRSSFDAFKLIYKTEGIRGFYTGLGASLLGASLVMMQLPLYERFKWFLQG